MNNNESTLYSPEYAGNGASENTAPSRGEQANQSANQPQSKGKDSKMGWGEKAAYAAGGAVFGAGMTMAGQAMAAPSAPAENPAELQEEADKMAAMDEAQAEETNDVEVVVEAQDSDEVAEVTVEAGGTTVHVTGNANIEVNNGTVHVTTGDGAPEPPVDNDKIADDVVEPEPAGPSPVPEDAIVATATGVRVAQVDDSASFAEAFADARAQVGPGGVFEWRGRVYGTYYKDEWDSMTPAERHEFQANIDYNEVLNDQSAPHHDSHHSSGGYENPTPPDHNDEVVTDHDVQVLDVGHIDINNDGIPEDAALLEIDGQEVIVVDIDSDGTADVMLSDINGDGQLEVDNISGEGMGMPGMDNSDPYLAQNDTPDYMNDADVSDFMA